MPIETPQAILENALKAFEQSLNNFPQFSVNFFLIPRFQRRPSVIPFFFSFFFIFIFRFVCPEISCYSCSNWKNMNIFCAHLMCVLLCVISLQKSLISLLKPVGWLIFAFDSLMTGNQTKENKTLIIKLLDP